MADPTTPADPNKGPYTSTETKTYKITGPIEITITTKYESSHVPTPADRGSTEDATSFLDALQPLATMILRKLEEIQRAQRSPEPS